MKVTVEGIGFDSLCLRDALRAAEGEEGACCTVVTPNALMLEACRREPALRELLNSASLVLPDGAGVLQAAKRQGMPLRERIAGIDFGEALLERAAARGERVFLLGGADGVAPLAAERLRERYEGLCICGAYWGYFEKDGEEGRQVIGMIRACRPSILLVGMGFPLQEQWMRDCLPFLPSVRVAAGLGGSLDVWAGLRRRAPELWRRHGMEWAWRMLSEPRRLRDLPRLISFAARGSRHR